MVLDLVRKEGKVAHIGWANDLPPLPVIPIMAKTLTIFGVGGNGGRGQYERSLELVRSGRVDLDPMVTHRFSLDDIERGIRDGGVQSGRCDQGRRHAVIRADDERTRRWVSQPPNAAFARIGQLSLGSVTAPQPEARL